MINLVYSNGCSHSAGGGLEIDRVLDSDNSIFIVDAYNKKYGLKWNNQYEISYIGQLAKLLNCNYVNEAASGGGSTRVVRMVYDFIKRNWDNKDNIFMFLEFPAFFHRIDLFSNKVNDYIIVNQGFDDNGKRDFLNGTRQFFIKEYDNDYKIINKNNELEIVLDNFINFDAEEQKCIKEIELLLSFLELNKIKYMWCEGGRKIQNKINPLFLKYQLDIPTTNWGMDYDFHSWCIKEKLTIRDEIENEKDMHPGYFGHKRFAEFLFDYVSKTYL